MTIKLLQILFLIWLFLIGSECAKIIALLPVSSKSHKNVFRPLMEELASRGHHVTVVSPYKDKTVPNNLREIVIKSNDKMMTEISKEYVMHSINNNRQLNINVSFITVGSDNFFEDPTMKELFKNGKQFDLAIISGMMNEASLIAAYSLADYVTFLCTGGVVLPGPTAPPTPLATLSGFESSFSKEWEFFRRLENTFVSVIAWNAFKFMSYSYIEESGRKHGLSLPTIDEARKGIALSLINADPVMATARPATPNVVHVGGMHCKPAKELPKELSDFIDSCGEEGFILFSLGSVMQGKYLPKKMQNEFLKAFSHLKQRVIWKFEENLDNLPPNVMIIPWTPQQDVLGHPKIRLFISHGGLLSIQEAIYHGVPVIGVPIFAEQPLNVMRVVELGIGEKLEIGTVSADEVYDLIQKILTTPSYSSEMKRLSMIIRDQTETPLERGVYWIEYILRHKGADHLRTSAEDIDYYKYFCLDIVALGIVSVVFPIFISCKLIRMLRKWK